MGIKNLTATLRKQDQDSDPEQKLFVERSFADLRGHWVAIDAFNVMYVFMAIAHAQATDEVNVLASEPERHLRAQHIWKRKLRDLLLRMADQGVAPFFVFDGESKQEKQRTVDERREKKRQIIAQIEVLRAQLPAEFDLETIMTHQATVKRLRELLRQTTYLTQEDITIFQRLLTAFGLPWVTAVGEGERLCASLCIYGYVISVLSSDSDSLAYGAPRVLIARGERSGTFEEVTLNAVLRRLGIDHRTFVDLCIMSGCDFNTNIPGIGVLKSLKLLKECGSIDHLPTRFDKSCLNHHVCRELFAITPPERLSVGLGGVDMGTYMRLSKEVRREELRELGFETPEINAIAKSISRLEIEECSFRIISYPFNTDLTTRVVHSG
jgi:flap endonuclease-1